MRRIEAKCQIPTKPRQFQASRKQGVVMLQRDSNIFAQGSKSQLAWPVHPHICFQCCHLRPLTATNSPLRCRFSAKQRCQLPDYTTMIVCAATGSRVIGGRSVYFRGELPNPELYAWLPEVQADCQLFNARQSSRPPCMTSRGTALCLRFKRSLPHQPKLKAIDEKSLYFSNPMLVLPKPLLILELVAGSR